MTYAIAAAGTGGHVYPGLAVGEALVARGIDPGDLLFVGGSRLEAEVYPAAGFPFLSVELRGLERRLTVANLAIPLVVAKAVGRIMGDLRRRGVRVVLGMGGYVTVPAGLAARLTGARLAVAEQNAGAGLANRMMARLAHRAFGAFPTTRGIPGAAWVGNPIRRELAGLDREALRPRALARYQLNLDQPVLGVFGGSLGAGALNRATEEMLRAWEGPRIQVLHLAGRQHAEALKERSSEVSVLWRVLAFEDQMEHFYAAADLVIARAGGAVAELTATATPAILVPGGFGSGGHQLANARTLEQAGAAVVLAEDELSSLDRVVAELIEDTARRKAMAAAAAALARPDAADRIAACLEELHG